MNDHYNLATEHYLEFYQAPMLEGIMMARHSTEMLDSTPLLYVHPTPLTGYGQVVKRIIPAVGNEVITLVKDTSLAFTIAVTEMFTIAKQLSSANTTMTPLIAAGVFYYIFNYIVAFTMERLEKRYSYYN